MTDNTTIWNALQSHLPKRRWISLADILTVLKTRILLDAEDLGHASSRSQTLCWEANVRRLLRLKVHNGIVRSRKKS